MMMRFVVRKLPSRILLASLFLAVSLVCLIEKDGESGAQNAQQDKLLGHPNWLAPLRSHAA
jgi:hypothetical protein